MVATIEKPTDNHEKELHQLSEEEIAAEAKRYEELDKGLYGRHTLLYQGIDAEAIYNSSDVARQNISPEDWHGAAAEGLPVDEYDAGKDIRDLSVEVQDELSPKEPGRETNYRAVESRVLGGHIDQQYQDGVSGERLNQENAAEVKNALIGQRYMEAFERGSQEDIELLNKLPIEVLNQVKLGAYQLQQEYGVSKSVSNEDLALLGEMVVAVAAEVSKDEESEPKLVYGNSEGELVIQTPEQAVEQIVQGDESAIEAIINPELKSEAKAYMDTLKVFYESGIVGADPNEREHLKRYLVEAFAVKKTIE